MVVIVLSKFCTFTVVRLISKISPSAPYLGMVIQSPIRTISLVVTCMLATKPIMVSLNINNSTADIAPMAVKNATGDFPVRLENNTTVPKRYNKIRMTCK
ncbi:hypothetical protein D3C85_1675800 [compost metagenome]